MTDEFNPNSALYWYPKIDRVADDIAVNVPETEFVEYDHMDALPLIEGETSQSLPWDGFVDAVDDVGMPAFVRTDQKSVKHAGPSAFRVDEHDDIPTVVATLTDFHAMAHRFPAALMVREWIDIRATFRAFDGMKIGTEFRIFANSDSELCDHFYWPRNAIEEGRGSPTTLDGEDELTRQSWTQRLHKAKAIHDADWDALYQAARVIADSLNAGPHIADTRAWSIDVAMDTDGDWWVIDAALARDSWHPEGCSVEFATDSGR